MDCRAVERLADINIKFTEVVAYIEISKISSMGEIRTTCLEDHSCTQ
jgi:hypothetical protein